MQYNVSSPQTRFNIFLHYFLQKFTANVFQFGEIILHIIATGWKMLMGLGESKKKRKTVRWSGMKGKKRQNCAYCWWDLCQTFCLMNTQNPALMLLINSCSAPSKRGIPSWHTDIRPLGPSKIFFLFFCCCCHCFSNIPMSQKYHNIKNKCNPFTKQWANK